MSLSEEPGASTSLVLIGGSSGGLGALQIVLSSLPEELDAAILVVLHTPQGISFLPDALHRHSRWPIRFAGHEEPFQKKHVVVAPTGYHLLLRPEGVWLHRGPRENRQRPAIDPFFRSAAKHHGNNVTAVLLSGLLDDGVAGLIRLQKSGARVIIQSPDDAKAPPLPLAALRHLTPDEVLPASEIASAIARLASTRRSEPHLVPPVLDLQKAGTLAVPDSSPEPFTCPTCHGNLWRVREDEFELYRCRIGHIFTPESLRQASEQEVESSLWVAIRNLEEAAEVSRRLSERSESQGLAAARKQHHSREVELMSHADVLRRLVEGLGL